MPKFSLAVGHILVFTAVAQSHVDQSAITAAAREELAATHTPGVAIGIVLENKLTYSFGVGTANVETGLSVVPDMLFRLGSTTKMMTATAVARLAAEGKLNLTDPVGKHVHGLDPAIGALTIHQILSHTSGLKDEAVMYGRHDDSALGDEIRQWKRDWLFTKPGAIYSYSNPGFWLAGLVVESVTGKPYADAMEELVFKPIGMTFTTLRPTMAMTHALSQGHDTVKGQTVVLRPLADNTANWPAGSIFSNLADLAQLTVALMNAGEAAGKMGISKEVVKSLTTPHADIPGARAKYGYGLEIETLGAGPAWRHAGSRAGYGSFIGMLPKQHIAVILLTNRTGENLPRTRAAIMAMLGFPEPEIEPTRTAPIPASDLAKYTGDFRNGSSITHVTARDGKLYFGENEALMGADGWLVLSSGGPAFPVSGADGRVAYLFQGGRCRARIN
jgi:CubicO group peptidase (beta-lactamase class C family)